MLLEEATEAKLPEDPDRRGNVVLLLFLVGMECVLLSLKLPPPPRVYLDGLTIPCTDPEVYVKSL